MNGFDQETVLALQTHDLTLHQSAHVPLRRPPRKHCDGKEQAVHPAHRSTNQRNDDNESEHEGQINEHEQDGCREK